MSLGEEDWTALMLAANAGDQVVYRRLLTLLAGALRITVRRNLARIGLPEAEAEDIVQETLLALHLKRQTWDPAAPLGPWVRAIARNKMIDSFRRRGRAVNVPIDDLIEILPAPNTEPDFTRHSIERHLPALPTRQRDVLQVIALDGGEIAEAARKLSMSEGAVRVALHRGLAALAAKFRGSGS